MRRREFCAGLLASLATGWAPAPARAATPRSWATRRPDVLSARALQKHLVAVATRQPTAESCVDAARACLWRGLLEAQAGHQPSAAVYQEGQRWAEKAKVRSPAHPGGHFFEAIHRAKRAELRGVVASVFELPTLRRLMDTVDRLAPGYGHAGTARFWGAVAAKTPTFLLRLKGSSLEEGDAYFQRAIKREPQFAGNHVLRAPLLARLHDEAHGTQSLRRAQRMPKAQDPSIEAWNIYYRREATRRLAG